MDIEVFGVLVSYDTIFFISLIVVALNVALFFKLWLMTNDVKEMKNTLSQLVESFQKEKDNVE